MRADSASSSTHFFNLPQPLIRLSCEMSISESALSGVPTGGVRNDLPGARNFSMTAMTSFPVASATAQISLIVVGRRVSRLSAPFSVRALNIFSAIVSPLSSADRFVMAQVNRLVRVILFLTLVPGAHQRVLQNRQLVRDVDYVVERRVDE